MLPNLSAPGKGSDDDADIEKEGSEQPKAIPSQKSDRKRTKTGCLTCRKRRIKCGEEKPVCTNCIKSKRHCDGYNPRIVFRKSNIGVPFPGQNVHPMSFHNGNHSAYGQYPQPSMNDPAVRPTLAYIRPRPPTESNALHADYLQSSASRYDGTFFLEPDARENLYLVGDLYARGHQQIPPDRKTSSNAQISNIARLASFNSGSSFQSLDRRSTGFPSMRSPHRPVQTQAPYIRREPYCEGQERTQNDVNSALLPDTYPGRGQQASLDRQEIHQSHSLRDTGNRQSVMTSSMPDAWRHPVQYRLPDSYRVQSDDPNLIQHYGPSLNSPIGRPCITQILNNAAVEVEDNDYYDVFPEEEDSDAQPQSLALTNNMRLNHSVLKSLHHSQSDYLEPGSANTFIYPGILDHYRPERVANPLRNPVTARIFGHFIASTGPMLSVFERHPRTASAMFGQGPEPNSQRSLWTDTLPMMALHNHGLLHAMLAVASLHISKLQGASTTPSLKHYTYSLKRVHRAVGQSKRRHEVSTLAATLLLGFYEIMTADHPKWSTHLCGASKLIHEIDFAGMSKSHGILKARTRSETFQPFGRAQDFAPDPSPGLGNARQPFVTHVSELDIRLVSDLMGRHLRYDDYGFIVDTGSGTTSQQSFTSEELSNFEVLQDLYWWYCKHDMVHAMIGGNALLYVVNVRFWSAATLTISRLNFERWAVCPPRAPIGLENAVYGTFDHLLLLLGRIADFIVRDRGRKIRASSVDGGHGIRPNTTANEPTQNYKNYQQQSKSVSGWGPREHQPSTANTVQLNPYQGHVSDTPPQPMPFYGMAPSSGVARMPRAFGLREPKSASPDLDVDDIGRVTAQALEEWNEILAACKTFAERLGPTFQPRSDPQSQSFMTPFGQAILYREYDIGLVWLLYYMTLIIATRCHPSMPPAATVAVGLAARETAVYANMVGRIAAGISITAVNSPLNASIGGAYADCTMPLFFAGVQYREPEQRTWTINFLCDIEQKSGWGSAGLCANGCETAWCRAAERGRGPPYERVNRDVHSTDNRVSGEQPYMSAGAPINAYDRRFVPYNEVAQMTWAIGLLGTEKDLQKMSLAEN